MYDQSQSFGPLLHQREFGIRLGLPHMVAGALYQQCCVDYKAQASDGISSVRVKHHSRPMRATGGADTTFGNTTCSGHGWAHVMYKLSGAEPPQHPCDPMYVSYLTSFVEESFASLGLSLKLKVHRNVESATFLKGMWYPHSGGQLFWGPLPSRFCKIGKSLRDPRFLYKTKTGGRPSLQMATERFVLPSGHAARSFSSTESKKDEPWKVAFTGQAGLGFDPRTPSDGYDWSFMLHRYALDASDLATMRGMVAKCEVGTLLQHPGFERLALIDYN